MIVKRGKREAKQQGAAPEQPTDKAERKPTKFQQLRKKYLKKQSSQKPIDVPPAEPPAIITKSQVPIVPQPKPQQVQPPNISQYHTNFKDIIRQFEPAPPTQQPQPVQKQSPFVLNGAYQKTLPIILAKKNMQMPDPPIQTPKESTQNESDKQDQQIQQPRIRQKTNYKLLISTPNQYCSELHQKGYIDDTLYTLIKLRIFNLKIEKTENQSIQYSSRNLALQPWTKILFQRFLVETLDIPVDHYQTAYDFLTQFFPPVNRLPDIVVVVISKLNQSYWKVHQQEVVSNSEKYLTVIRKYGRYISETKKTQFSQYILKSLSRFVKLEAYCIAFLKIVYEFPSLLRDQHIVEFNNECKLYQHAAILHLLLTHRQEKLSGKGVSGNTMTIVKYLEEDGCFQQCLRVLDTVAHTSSQSAYSAMREVRLRIVGKLEQKESEAKKGSKASLFNLFNQAIGVITNPKASQDGAVPSGQPHKDTPKTAPKDGRKQ